MIRYSIELITRKYICKKSAKKYGKRLLNIATKAGLDALKTASRK